MLILPHRPIDVPALDTPRLRLRGHRIDGDSDVGACCELWADPIVTRFIGGRPSSAEEVWARILRYRGLWAHLGYGYWAVEDKESGRYVGELGFADFQRALGSSSSPEVAPFGDRPELGWALAPRVHGRGYATEALTAALAWGDAHFGVRSTVCMIDPDNAPSIRVARRCGYHEYARTDYKGAPSILFERMPASR